MKAFVTTSVLAREKSNTAIRRSVVKRSPPSSPVRVEVGNGAIAPKVAIVRRKASAPVRVEVGNGAIAPKVALVRARTARTR
jgi:hypothetical protein